MNMGFEHNISKTDLHKIAERVVWWQKPDAVLRNDVLFLSHVMIYGLARDVDAVRNVYGDDAFRHALRNAWPGMFDPRSWAYWHLVLDMLPTPPLPTRQFPFAPGEEKVSLDPSLQWHF
ncbi:MAG: hypothetical protein OXD38_01275 [Aestuariivita sp.]|nr:hypothetical protein [Aestuariivita sp.]